MSELSWLESAVALLAEKSWCQLPGVLPPGMIHRLNDWIDKEHKLGHFKLAGIGKGVRQQSDHAIRRDQTLWLPAHSDEKPIVELQACIESLRMTLNSELFSGLEGFEGHFSIYESGSFYKRHVDAFRDDDSRSITFIIYLNESWRAGDGGELKLETGSGSEVLIPPTKGTIVLFDSRKFYHEVLPARRERRSFTGWFKVRSLK